MACSFFRQILTSYATIVLILISIRHTDHSRVSINRNVIVRKKLFSDNRAAEARGDKQSDKDTPVQNHLPAPTKQLPMISPLYPVGTAPVAGLQSVRLGKDGSAPLLEQTSSSFDSDCTDPEDEWAQPRMMNGAHTAAAPVARQQVSAASHVSAQS
jgi:hypothetical protein